MTRLTDRIAALVAVARTTIGLDVETTEARGDDAVVLRLSALGANLGEVTVSAEGPAYSVDVYDAFHREPSLNSCNSPLAAVHLALANSAETSTLTPRPAGPDPYAPAFSVDRAAFSVDAVEEG